MTPLPSPRILCKNQQHSADLLQSKNITNNFMVEPEPQQQPTTAEPSVLNIAPALLVHKCPHYQRNCHVEAPCCLIFYPCKLCHDELYKGPKANWCKTQRMQFEKVPRVKCLNCQTIQQPGENCSNCQTRFGAYCCLKCRLYENSEKKKDDIFHCDKCGMCRRGKKEQNTHCDKCGYCVASSAYNDHKCFEKKVESNCPVCLENLKYSTKFYQPMECGHLIHVHCFKILLKSGEINCPICGLSFSKMGEQEKKFIQQAMEQTKDQIPEQLKNKKVNILCHECMKKTFEVPFHFYGLKCGDCGSFNTKMI